MVEARHASIGLAHRTSITVDIHSRLGGRSPWRAGVAKAVITPETPVWLAGYGTKRPPDGKLHDLWMKALALEDAAGQRAVLVTSDFQGVPKSMSDRVFAQLQAKHRPRAAAGDVHLLAQPLRPAAGRRPGRLLSGRGRAGRSSSSEYTGEMVDRTVVAWSARRSSKLAPARLQTGQGKATFAVNRRNNREADVPALLAEGKPLAGPGRSRGAGDDRHAARRTAGGDPVRLCLPSDDAQLHDLVRRLSRLRPARAGSRTSRRDGDVRQHLRRRSKPAAAPQRRTVPAATATCWPRRSKTVVKQPLEPVSPGLRTAFEYVELPY